MFSTKIARLQFRRARQEELSAFAAQVVKAIDDHPTLATIGLPADKLKEAAARYADSLAVYLNSGSKASINAKNYAKRLLIRALEAYADAVEDLTAEDGQLIIEAGFTQQLPSTARLSGRIPPPLILQAKSTGNRGELRIRLEDFFPRAIRSHLFEYSLDSGLTWQNGPFNNRRYCVIEGLPHSASMQLRVKSIGTGSATSDWSEPVIVAVP
ncbi:MAG: hypothetical protein SFV22_10470 [Saprospiraceae bacterium]|nr:hypothetical protein [Saprospiraceae bacterium]